ncbi:MAG: tyrosine-type recombinase/integrase [Magnetococcales bacterium]|nr:tyrosine-type recombinase/integrase [Magnetococcales bacterium]MBF0438114.1 tyrosine-type recombinase/integrase [Magnetococcales bacterium]
MSSIPAETTVETALGWYLEQVSARKSPATHEREQRKARQISARLGRVLLQELTPLDVSEYRDHRLREASAAIVQGDLALLQDLFEVAVGTWGLVLDGNPVNGVSPPRSAPSRSHALAHGEMVRLLAACDRRPQPMLGWIVRIALQTAMSKDEILRLRKGDVDLKERVITIPKVLNRPMRQVPMTREAVRVLKEAVRYPERPADETLLFYGAMGSLGIRRPLAIDKAFRMVVLQARMKGFRFNDLRNEAISRLEAAGLTEVEVLTMAGLPFPRMAKRPPRPTIEELVARLDGVGL